MTNLLNSKDQVVICQLVFNLSPFSSYTKQPCLLSKAVSFVSLCMHDLKLLLHVSHGRTAG